jgi:hypothetical protein
LARARRSATLWQRENTIRELEQNCAQAKTRLKQKIQAAKTRARDRLRETVENDPWGKGYRIVTRKLGRRTPLSPDERREADSGSWGGKDYCALTTVDVDISESIKYLGVIIDRGLLWIEYARYVAGKVMAAAHKVRGVAGRTWGTGPRTLRKIYNGAIRPVLLYGAEVWGERSTDPQIQRYLRTAQRSFSWESRERTGRRRTWPWRC